MYEVVNEDYPRLETYLCYECGFHTDSILMEQKRLYQQYQQLFMYSKGLLLSKNLIPKRSPT
jgi:hypothetical protein